MQVAGDAAAFLLGRVQGVAQQILALVLGPPQPPGQREHERHLQQLQQHQRAEAERREPQPELAAGLGDPGVLVVGLEQQRLLVRRLDRQVDLEQLLGRLLEPVLRPAQVRQLRLGLVGGQRLPLLALELELLADQLVLVGVEDRAVRGPDLDPGQRAAQHLAADDVVHLRQRLRVAGQQPVVEHRLDGHVGGERGPPAGVVDRGPYAEAAAGPGREHRDHDQRDESGEDVPCHQPGQHDRLVEDGSAGQPKPTHRSALSAAPSPHHDCLAPCLLDPCGTSWRSRLVFSTGSPGIPPSLCLLLGVPHP